MQKADRKMASPDTPDQGSKLPRHAAELFGRGLPEPAKPTVPNCDQPSPSKGSISVASLREGMRLAQDIFDDGGVLLLAAGTQVTSQFLQLLNRHHTRSVNAGSLTAPDTEVLQTVHTRRLDSLLSTQLENAPRPWPVKTVRRARLPVSALTQQAAKGLEKRNRAGLILAEVCEKLRVGKGTSNSSIDAIIRDFAQMVALDADLLPLIAGPQPTPDEYIFDHCVNVAMISMAIASQLGMSRDQATEVGIGGLLADIGMLRVPREIRLANRQLTPDERVEILRHPAHTVDMLENIAGLPLPAKFIGYQSHERIDGSGYPRRRSGMLIHQYAKIVAIADSYVAMTGPRPHRSPLAPYNAAKQILFENSKNKFERTIVCAFLDCVSLFPIGSYVELSDGRAGTVLRANPGCHTKPIILQLDQDKHPTGLLIDLSKEQAIEVIRTGPAPLPSEGHPALVLP